MGRHCREAAICASTRSRRTRSTRRIARRQFKRARRTDPPNLGRLGKPTHWPRAKHSIPIAPPPWRRFSPTGSFAYRPRSTIATLIDGCAPRPPGKRLSSLVRSVRRRSLASTPSSIAGNLSLEPRLAASIVVTQPMSVFAPVTSAMRPAGGPLAGLPAGVEARLGDIARASDRPPPFADADADATDSSSAAPSRYQRIPTANASRTKSWNHSFI